MKLIDADKLIEDLEYDIELNDRALSNLDMVGRARELIQQDRDRKQYAVYLLKNRIP